MIVPLGNRMGCMKNPPEAGREKRDMIAMTRQIDRTIFELEG